MICYRSHQRERSTNVKRELNLVTVLIFIVIVFIICHIPRVILNCMELLMIDKESFKMFPF